MEHVDGVMVGREAYHNPWWLAGWDETFCGTSPSELTRELVEEQMVAYMEREAAANGTSWYSIARHMLGLRHGQPGARKWRQVWSDHRLKALPAKDVWAIARQVD
jgi:tRNA-dihydrouridine synthase A